MPIKRGKLKQVQLTLTDLFSRELKELSTNLNLSLSETITEHISKFVNDRETRKNVLKYTNSQYKILSKDEKTSRMSTYNILEKDNQEIEKIANDNDLSKSMIIRGTISYFLNVVYKEGKKKIDALVEKLRKEGHEVTGEFLQTDNQSVYIKFALKR